MRAERETKGKKGSGEGDRGSVGTDGISSELL